MGWGISKKKSKRNGRERKRKWGSEKGTQTTSSKKKITELFRSKK